MNRKAKEIKQGVRLNIKKPPKVETPKNVYTRKEKHKKGYDDKNSCPFFISSSHYLVFSRQLFFLKKFFSRF